MKIHLYLLKGPYPQYYCGKAKNLGRRMIQHRIGHGSKVTKNWKNFELIRSLELEVKNESEAHFAEASFTRQMRAELPGMMVYGPGDHKEKGYLKYRSKKPGGNTYNF